MFVCIKSIIVTDLSFTTLRAKSATPCLVHFQRRVLRLLELLGHPGGCLPVAPRGHLRSHDFGQGVSVPCRLAGVAVYHRLSPGWPGWSVGVWKFYEVLRCTQVGLMGLMIWTQNCWILSRYNPVTKVILDDSHRSWRHLLGDHPRLSRHCGQVCVEDGELVGGCNDLRCCPKLGSQFLMTSMNFKFWISNSNTSMMIWVSHQDFQRYVSGSHRSPEAKGKELTSIYDFFIGRREGTVVLERLLGFDAFSLHFLNSDIWLDLFANLTSCIGPCFGPMVARSGFWGQ